METDSPLSQILSQVYVIPVLTVERAEHAVPLARALAAGGLNVIEMTLRTGEALKAIEHIAAEAPDVIVGAGTILSVEDIRSAEKAGARFAVSPGSTPELLEGARTAAIPLLPGVATASDIMRVYAAGFTYAKFFPAEAAGGLAMLRAFAGPFPQMRFCPTGGVGPANFRTYLGLANVGCVGGSWVAPADAIARGDWHRITALAQQTTNGAAEHSVVSRH